MNVFKHEFKTYLRSTISWAMSLSILFIVFASFYPSLMAEADTFMELMSNFPPLVLKALGMAMNSLTSWPGFYSFFFLYISFCGAIQAMTLGLTVLSKEGTRKTCDFLLTKPISRFSVLLGKFTAVLALLLINNVIYFSVVLIVAPMHAGFDGVVFSLITLSLLFIQVTFAALGFTIGAVLRKVKAPSGFSLGVVFAFFAVNMIGQMLGDAILKFISVFSYFDIQKIIRTGKYDTNMVLLDCAVIITLVVVSFITYIKKDIHTS